MKNTFVFCSALFCSIGTHAQEAGSGLDVRATVSAQMAVASGLTEPPRSGAPVASGYRVIVYPVLKFNDHWAITAALQSYSRPYFQEQFTTEGHGIEDNILEGTLNYSRISDKGSLLVRAGELSTTFGSFLLHYDDADNALIDLPLQYGYYYKPVTTLGMTGAQIDATLSKWDGRIQFANSSPANPRSIFTSDQYPNWAGGGGYTIRQGLRVGVSAYRGPYLDRKYRFFFPGEAPPKTLPAHAFGFDFQWARGHWNVQGEWQSFFMPYVRIANFHEQAGYGEVKRVLSPRWYVASRSGYTHTSSSGNMENFEATAGFSPNRLQILKVGYEMQHREQGTSKADNTLTFQLVTSFHVFSLASH